MRKLRTLACSRVAAELAARWAGLPGQQLDHSPYLLFGSPARMAEALLQRAETYGLERISLKEGGGNPYAPDPVRFLSLIHI